jgi:cell division septal protein FtsQ
MATKKRTPVKRTTRTTRRTASRKPIVGRKSAQKSVVFNTIVPLVIMTAILVCLGFLFMMGVRSVSASPFFETSSIEIHGNIKIQREEIERIVRANSTDSRIFNADLDGVRADIEKLPFTKGVIVTRVLPNTLRISVSERIPKAMVRLKTGDFWYDDEARRISPVAKTDPKLPFYISGWSEEESDKARKDNQDRIKLYRKLIDDWDQLGISERVVALDLSDLNDTAVTIEDSEKFVTVSLGNQDQGKRLKSALDVVSGKGREIESLISHGTSVIARPRGNQPGTGS